MELNSTSQLPLVATTFPDARQVLHADGVGSCHHLCKIKFLSAFVETPYQSYVTLQVFNMYYVHTRQLYRGTFQFPYSPLASKSEFIVHSLCAQEVKICPVVRLGQRVL